MCTRQECFDRLRDAAPYIRKEYGVTAMTVFGSMARGDNRPGSDVDIFVDMPAVGLFKILNLKTFLQNLLGASVDLVRRHASLSPFFLQQIRQDGISIFEKP